MIDEEGFSLIEALVALAIIAIAAAGLIRAAEAHVDRVRGLELRAAAQWVAENRLAELRLGGSRGAPAESEMLGYRWRIAENYRLTADPDLRQVEIGVILAGQRDPTVTLKGFIDAGSTTRR